MILQWVCLAVGLLMTVIGGALKTHDMLNSEGVAEYMLLSGEDYILMIAGLVMVFLALGYDLLFKPGDEP